MEIAIVFILAFSLVVYLVMLQIGEDPRHRSDRMKKAYKKFLEYMKELDVDPDPMLSQYESLEDLEAANTKLSKIYDKRTTS